jgi:hypothetical protein
MAVRRPSLNAVAELYVGHDLTLVEVARAVAFQRKVPRMCETCSHEAAMHWHPAGFCMALIDAEGEECDCEGMRAHGRLWRVL